MSEMDFPHQNRRQMKVSACPPSHTSRSQMNAARARPQRQRPPSGKINFIDKILPPPPMPAALTETTSCKFRRTTALVTGRERGKRERRDVKSSESDGRHYDTAKNGPPSVQWWSGGRDGGKPTPEKVAAAALGGFGRWILIGGVSGGEGEGARCRDYVQLQTKPNQTAPPK